jgi:cobalt-zinc-cadmium efflux system outer membrane protein
MRTRSFIQLLIVLFLAPVVLCAQQAPLDLRTALEIAEKDNLELKAARQQRAIALAGITTAKQYPNPNIAFGITRDSPHESLSLDQPFELAGQRSKRIAVAKEEQRSTEIDIGVLSRNVRRRTRDAFFNVMTARAQREQAIAALDLATKLKNVAQQRFDAGDVAQLDVMEADVELARAQAELDSLTQEVHSAKAEFNALLGRNTEDDVSLTGELNSVPQALNLEANTEKALVSSSVVQQATQDLATEEKRLTLAKAARVPNIDLQVNTALNNPPSYRAALGGAVSMSVPLWYRGEGEIAQSTARIELLKLTLQSQKLSAAAQVAVAFYDYSAKALLAAQFATKIMPQTEKLAGMAEESYKAGKSNLLTVIDAQRKLNEVRRAYLDSLFAVQSAFAALEEATGAPLD